MRLLPGVRGRVARPAGTGWNIAKTLIQIVVMWTIFYALAPAAIYALEKRMRHTPQPVTSPRLKTAGVIMFILGGLLGLTSAAFMVIGGKGTPLPADAARQLVIAGPYRYVRNPMALGSFAQGVAVGLYLGSPLVVLYTLSGMIGWNYLVRPWEEADLEARFGEPYVLYRDSVRCWVPQATPYDPLNPR